MPSHCPLPSPFPATWSSLKNFGGSYRGVSTKKSAKSLKYCIFCLHIAWLDKRCTQLLSRDVILLARLSKQCFTVREIHCLRHMKAALEEHNSQPWLRWASNGPQDCSLNRPLSKESTTCWTQLRLPRCVNKTVSLQVSCYGLFFFITLSMFGRVFFANCEARGLRSLGVGNDSG